MMGGAGAAVAAGCPPCLDVQVVDARVGEDAVAGRSARRAPHLVVGVAGGVGHRRARVRLEMNWERAASETRSWRPTRIDSISPERMRERTVLALTRRRSATSVGVSRGGTRAL